MYFQVYDDRNWVLAEDHIHFTMGKQAHHMKQLSDALNSYSYLVDQKYKKSASSKQSTTQQLAYIREYLSVLMQFLKLKPQEKQPHELPLPVIDNQATKIFIGTPNGETIESGWERASHLSFDGDDSRNNRWFALEKEILQFVQGNSAPMIFKPNLELLTSNTPNTNSPSLPINEQVCVQLTISNPLSVSLTITQIQLFYDFEFSSSADEQNNPVDHEVVDELVLLPNCENKIILKAIPKYLGKLIIKGILYNLSLTPDSDVATTSSLIVSGQQSLKLIGPRLNSNMKERNGIVYAIDRRLELDVVLELPKMQILFKKFPTELKCGQVHGVDIQIKNGGPCSLDNLVVAITDPKHTYFTTDFEQLQLKHINIFNENESKSTETKSRASSISLPNGKLDPGEVINGKLWLHAPLSSSTGTFDVELLFYYQPSNREKKNVYRLKRHLSIIKLDPSISIKAHSSFSQSVHGSNMPTLRPHSANLSLSIQNITENSNNSTIKIFALSSSSKNWILMPLSLPTDLEIQPNQLSRICVKCIVDGNGESLNFSTKNSNPRIIYCHLPFHDKTTPPPCCREFNLRQRIRLRDLLADPLPPDPAADLVPPPPTQDELDSAHMVASVTMDMYLTILWQNIDSDGSKIYGQHSVWLGQIGDDVVVPSPPPAIIPINSGGFEDIPPARIIPVNPEPIESLSLPSASLQQYLIKATLDAPDSIIHDFNQTRLCSIKFKVTIYNCSGCHFTTSIHLGSSTGSGMTDGSSQLFVPQASTQLMYVGGTVKNIKLQPWGTHTINVSTIVNNVGTYCVGVLKLSYRRRDAEKDEPFITQMCQLQTAVSIRQSCSSGQKSTS